MTGKQAKVAHAFFAAVLLLAHGAAVQVAVGQEPQPAEEQPAAGEQAADANQPAAASEDAAEANAQAQAATSQGEAQSDAEASQEAASADTQSPSSQETAGADEQVAVAPAEAESGKPFTWSAELVAFDEGSRTATVKVLLDSHADKDAIANLSEGERVTLRWTGITWGASVSNVLREGERPEEGALALPVEFVRAEDEGRYIVFNVPVPMESVERIKALEAGQWVTGTSPRNATDTAQAVSELRPYNDVS